jgi:hypothetical protein
VRYLDPDFEGSMDRDSLHISRMENPSQRKPLAKSPSEKRPKLNVQRAMNSLSRWPTRVAAGANPRKRRHNWASDTFSCHIRDLLAERKGFELLVRSDSAKTNHVGDVSWDRHVALHPRSQAKVPQ